MIRRDSPNGKRYARKGRGGDIELAFGFDLSPLVARADEFEAGQEVRAEERALKLVRERITLCGATSQKIPTGIEENVPVRGGGDGPTELGSAYTPSLRSMLARIPRTATRLELEPVAEELSLLADEVLMALEDHVKTKTLSADESQTERHTQNSNPNSPTQLEPPFQESAGARAEPKPEQRGCRKGLSLGMVLDACPDLADYAKTGNSNRRDFLATVAVVRPMLGISPSAWEEAQAVMGELQAAMVVAAILQRGAAIASAGGYIRGLTEKARAGQFSPGPMLMALIGKQKRAANEKMTAAGELKPRAVRSAIRGASTSVGGRRREKRRA